MTDDELSELAECLASACDESPVKVSAYVGVCCPMGALVGRGSWKPLPWHPRLLALIDRTVAHDFMTGFDGLTNFDDERAHNLGKLFRSLYP